MISKAEEAFLVDVLLQMQSDKVISFLTFEIYIEYKANLAVNKRYAIGFHCFIDFVD